MKYYSVGELEITDRSWVRDYVESVTRMVERRGGRFLARTGKMEKMEGARKLPQTLVLIEWPSKEAALAFYESEGYRPYREKRIAGGSYEFMLVAGEDATKTARIAP